ncbi:MULTISPECIES: hypothetical protein [unclassified Streptomyces]|uniref:hypothetical protein n=1 Tax=unclassified Streptomyces TaxID=2593676 RepID=UPI0011E66329|nr:hypothetical protein [Streptomyces sp. sk2.1]
MKKQPLEVACLGDDEKVPRRVRSALGRANRRGRTGLLFHADMRSSFRSFTFKWAIVLIERGGVELCHKDGTTLRGPKFVDLSPGAHTLTFRVVRARRSRGTLFEKEIFLRKGDVFMALCEPIQPNVFYRKSPEEDIWRLRKIEFWPGGGARGDAER